jgi:hypothetical protein
MKVQCTNPDLSYDERTTLTADYSSGTSLTVRNNRGYTTSWYVVVGEPGQEQTETRAVTSASGSDTIIMASALSFSHPKSTPVYLCQYNQISFERKPSGGSYTELSDSPFNIEWDNEDNVTLIVVTGGASTDTYRWRFYNSALASYSDYSDTLAGTGYTRKTVGYVIEQIRKNAVASSVDDETIMSYMNDYQNDIVYPELPKAWWFRKTGTAVSTAASDYDYDIVTNWSDLASIDLVLYRYISGSTSITYPLSFSPYQEFYNLKSDSSQAADDYAKKWSFLPADSTATKGYIGLHPTPKTTACYLIPVYFFELTDLDSFGDRLVIPYPKGYIDYVFYRIYDDIKSDSANADKYASRVARGITYLKRIARRNLGQPELFRYRGHRGFSRLYGEQTGLSSEDTRELYW